MYDEPGKLSQLILSSKQQFAAEWQNQQPSIERLSAMEKDLALLIEVLSANSDLIALQSKATK